MKKAIRFAAAVCLVSWAAFGIFYAACGGDIAGHKLAFSAFCTIYMLFPMLTAMALQKIDKEPFRSTGLLKFRPRWSWVAAIAIPLVVTLLATLVSGLMPGVRLEYNPEQMISMFSIDEATADTARAQFEMLSPAMMILATTFSGIMAGCTINALFAFGEEYGWRNYMAAALKDRSFLISTLVIGLVWGIWHAPIILMGHNYPQHPVAGVFMMIVVCFLLGFIELYLVRKTGSVFPAAICHGTFNAVCGACLYFVNGGNDLTIGCTGAAGFISLGIICAGIYFYDRYISKEHVI